MLVTSGTLPHAQPRRANRFCEGGMFRSRLLALGVLVFMVVSLVPLSQRAAAVSSSIVISQVYGGGGNAGATFRNDFIELYNRGTAPVDLTGWSVQYAATIGTSWNRTDLTAVTLAPGQYYLVQEAAGGGGGGKTPAAPRPGGAAPVAPPTPEGARGTPTPQPHGRPPPPRAPARR